MMENSDGSDALPRGLGHDSFPRVQNRLLGALDRIYLSIVQVDLHLERMTVLQSLERPQAVGGVFDWKTYARWYCRRFILEADRQKATSLLCAENLRREQRRGKEMISLEVRHAQAGAQCEWIALTAFLYEEDGHGPMAYLFVRRAGRERLLKSIVDLYVYNNCDYFIYIEAGSNKYEMFSGKDGTPLPDAQGDNYAEEVRRYAENFVIPEDRETVLREMRIDRVLEALEHAQVHDFYCGILDPVHGYRRKRLEYRYYDREAKTILLTRTDVTGMYREEQFRRRELHAALRRAQTDPLTGLLNYQGTQEQVALQLERERERAALLFIDLDDFKRVNDTLGHAAGDELLRGIAGCLRANLRPTDIVGRVGGDEFVVLLSNIASRAAAGILARRLCRCVAESDCGIAPGTPVSCSIGISIFPEDGTQYHVLRENADRLAYQAKLAGKNRVYDGETDAASGESGAPGAQD